ncbi:MAG: hypothetical protein EOO61_03205 [Hymenobacter sp.]|nr:MAG: hypothetical protein EOO61_03205 [Hymenobacter sp.]
MEPETPQTFSQLMREGNRFTDRDFMKVLGIGHPALKGREADPSRFTLEELLRLAKMLNRPELSLFAVILEEVKRNLSITKKVEVAVKQSKGRKNFPRTPSA